MVVASIQSQPYAEIVQLPLERITSKLPVRRLSASGIARLTESMKRSGFLDNYPLVVTPDSEDFQLIDGNHRYEAAKGLGIQTVPCVIKTELTEQERYKLALQSNNAAETVVPSTLVTFAEFVWNRANEGKTQEEIANMLMWERGKVAKYAMLHRISKDAWDMIC